MVIMNNVYVNHKTNEENNNIENDPVLYSRLFGSCKSVRAKLRLVKKYYVMYVRIKRD